MRVREVVCTGRFARFMRRRHWTGVTLPVCPGVVVVLYWTPPSAVTRAHEWVHVGQVARYGWLGFVARYLWGMRKGYRLNPLEREAYGDP